jgi:biotin carboxyl carrier protein
MSARKYTVSVSGRPYSVELRGRTGSTLTFIVEGSEYSVDVTAHTTSEGGSQTTPKAARTTRESTGNQVRAPMPGIVSELKVAQGNSVQTGDTLLVIEAMKMENPIKSPRSGTIKELHVTKGQEVSSGAPLVTFE